MSKYRIQSVAQLTGLSSALIRAWEARYRLVQPERTPAGYRLYSDSDIAILRGAQSLVRQGMAPMQISQLPREQILSAQRLQVLPSPNESLDEALGEPPGRSSSAGPTPAVAAGTPKESTNLIQPLSFAERIDRLIEAFCNFDNRAAEDLLATPLQSMPPEQVCRELLLPLLVDVGERWHRGELSVAVEHFGTTLIRGKLLSLLAQLRPEQRRHQVVCACPPGDLHEMGLLLFALDATMQGWDTVYLGADVPIGDLLLTARKVRPSLVGLSFVMRHDPNELRRLLAELKSGLDGISQLLVGGSGLRGQSEIVRSAGCLMMPETGRLDDLLLLPPPARRQTAGTPTHKRVAQTKSAKKFLP